jgi:hypothetical protein
VRRGEETSRDGIDPATHREEKRAAAEVTFKVVGEEWLKGKGYASATLAKARWLFDQWLYPDLGDVPIAAIKPADLLPIIRRAEDDGANERAHRIRSRASQVFRFGSHRPEEYPSLRAGRLRSR